MDAAERSPYQSTTPRLPWWSWILAGHVIAVYLLYYGIFEYGWAGSSARRVLPFSLAGENNFAVWWSGLCLLLPGLLFLGLGVARGVALRDRLMWVALSGVVLALSLDEVGSLHERVSLVGGWWALLPFGLIGSAVFAYAIFRMLGDPGARFSGLLVMISLGLFFGVALLEQLESVHYFTGAMGRIRLVVEEAVELVAETLLILSAALQVARREGTSASRVSILVAPRRLPWFDLILFGALLLHLAISILMVPEARSSGRGNPEIWYPMAVFLLVAFHHGHGPRELSARPLLRLVTLVTMVLLSAGQMYNYGRYAAAWWPQLIDEPTWENWWLRIAATGLPVLLLLAFRVGWKRWIGATSMLAAVAGILSTGADHFESYYIFSAVAAYLAYRFLVGSSSDALPAWERGAN